MAGLIIKHIVNIGERNAPFLFPIRSDFMNDKILIINFSNECIGSVERTPHSYIQNYQGNIEEFETLPSIMQGIASKSLSNKAFRILPHEAFRCMGISKKEQWI